MPGKAGKDKSDGPLIFLDGQKDICPNVLHKKRAKNLSAKS